MWACSRYCSAPILTRLTWHSCMLTSLFWPRLKVFKKSNSHSSAEADEGFASRRNNHSGPSLLFCLTSSTSFLFHQNTNPYELHYRALQSLCINHLWERALHMFCDLLQKFNCSVAGKFVLLNIPWLRMLSKGILWTLDIKIRMWVLRRFNMVLGSQLWTCCLVHAFASCNISSRTFVRYHPLYAQVPIIIPPLLPMHKLHSWRSIYSLEATMTRTEI